MPALFTQPIESTLMNLLCLRRLVFAIACSAVLAATASAEDAAVPPTSLSAALQPFVESHSLAGAVTLAANKDQILSLEAVGYAV